LEELLAAAVEYYLQELVTGYPGRIEAYDAEKQVADVKPLVQRLQRKADGSELLEALPVIPAVPIVFPRGGGYYLSFPVAVGDYCLLLGCHRSIDKYKSGRGADTNPQDFRLHHLTDMVALMGFAPIAQAIADADTERVVLGKEKGTQLHVADGQIELGGKALSDKASLDSKVQTELARLAADVNELKTLFATWIPSPSPDGGASLKAHLGAWYGDPIAIEPTASSLVTIKE
jgi:hypothetical protein